jgi:hypothetical protein
MPTKTQKRAAGRAQRRNALVGRVGGIAADVAEAALSGLSDDALYGAFYALSRRLERDPEIHASWEEAGRQWRESRALCQTPVLARFDAKIPKVIAQQLREAGLSQDRALRMLWRGRANPDDVAAIVEAAGGELTVLDG